MRVRTVTRMVRRPERRGATAQEIFGSNVRSLRLELGLSQEELANRTGLHRTYVSSVERGQRNISLDGIRRLAEQLGVSASDLLRGV